MESTCVVFIGRLECIHRPQPRPYRKNADLDDHEMIEDKDDGDRVVVAKDTSEDDVGDDRDLCNDLTCSDGAERKKERRKERVALEKRGEKRPKEGC